MCNTFFEFLVFSNSMFWFIHVIIILILIFIPYKKSGSDTRAKKTDEPTSSNPSTSGAQTLSPEDNAKEPVQRLLSHHLKEV